MIDIATETDIPELAAMMRQLNQAHVGGNPARFHDLGRDEKRQAFFATAFPAGGRVLVYRLEGCPRGYLLWNLRMLGVAAFKHPRRLAVLDHIFVDPIC